MIEKQYRVPYSESFFEFKLPSRMPADLASSQQVENLLDIPQANLDALANPIGDLPLRDLTELGERICIVFKDNVYASPDYPLVTALMEKREEAVILDNETTRLCGASLKLSSMHAKNITKLGSSIVDRYRANDNGAQNPAASMDEGLVMATSNLEAERQVLLVSQAIRTLPVIGKRK